MKKRQKNTTITIKKNKVNKNMFTCKQINEKQLKFSLYLKIKKIKKKKQELQ